MPFISCTCQITYSNKCWLGREVSLGHCRGANVQQTSGWINFKVFQWKRALMRNVLFFVSQKLATFGITSVPSYHKDKKSNI